MHSAYQTALALAIEAGFQPYQTKRATSKRCGYTMLRRNRDELQIINSQAVTWCVLGDALWRVGGPYGTGVETLRAYLNLEVSNG